jgi:hypothetical protein
LSGRGSEVMVLVLIIKSTVAVAGPARYAFEISMSILFYFIILKQITLKKGSNAQEQIRIQ